jgi:bifunctional non-homologous end joining protein LigD
MEEIAAGGERYRKGKAGKAVAGNEKAIDALVRAYDAVQLATLVDKPPEGAEWLHEVKFDGYRLLGFASGGAARLRTRNGQEWTGKLPAIAAALEALKVKSAVLDMEAVVVDAEGRSSFQALQAALGEGAGGEKPIVAYAFDLLHLNGKDLRALPLSARKKKLYALLVKAGSKALLYSDHIAGRGGEMRARSCDLGLEGIVSKRADAPYRGGRQKSWLKSKCARRQEFIILGSSAARKGGRALGALYLGFMQGGRLRYAGKVGTGFTMAGARALAGRLEKIAVREPLLPKKEMMGLPAGEWQRIRWAKPEILCEVAFTEWTEDNHIRHPSFQGLREDKEARAVTKEKPVPVAKAAAREPDDLVLHGVRITHPGRIVFEAGHITKGQLARYYAAAAPLLLPGIVNRPLSLLRCPSGIGGGCFFQRNPGGLGRHVYPFAFHHKGKKYEYLYIRDAAGLMELVQMGAVEIHPWGAKVGNIDRPDRLIFDLDPAPDVPFAAVKLAARDLRARLKKLGLSASLKCTGGKGLHVTVALAGKDGWEEVKDFARALAREMVAAAPEAYTATMSKEKRAGKIFIDFFRNDYTATAIADYAVRARPGAPVALPLEWRELAALESGASFTIEAVLKRIRRKKPGKEKPQRLPR